MTLSRGVLRPAKVGLSYQSQWRQVTKTSDVNLQPALIETSNPVHRSNIQWRGRSYAASAPSDALEPKKPRKRVSKDERKSMVEHYVNKYRATNAGKFPTVSDAQKDVGGSYYVIRQILQELKYNSEISSMDNTDVTTSQKVSAQKDKLSAVTGAVSQTRELGYLNQIPKMGTKGSSFESFEPREAPQSSNSVEESVSDKTKQFSAVIDKSIDVGNQSDQPTDEPKSSLPANPENIIKQGSVSKNKVQLDRLQAKGEPQEPAESDTSKRELHKVHTEDAEPQTKPSVWQNLKSFANGIIGIWRRS